MIGHAVLPENGGSYSGELKPARIKKMCVRWKIALKREYTFCLVLISHAAAKGNLFTQGLKPACLSPLLGTAFDNNEYHKNDISRKYRHFRVD